MKLIDLLSESGVLLKEPYTRHIRGKLRELRVKDSLGHIRVLYFTFTGRRFVLLHGFVKKTGKAPEREIDLAEKRMQDYVERPEASHERESTSGVHSRPNGES